MKKIIFALLLLLYLTPIFAKGGQETAPQIQENGTSKAIVIYFSATGNTKRVAEKIAEIQNIDIQEIIPQQLYTTNDLNYNDNSSRSSIEQNDDAARPIIANTFNLEEYEIIYLGYPIWWSDMPKILYTFLDSYNLSGKIIAPFCTSGGSGLSRTVNTIKEMETEATVTEGLSIRNSNNSENAINNWLTDLGLR